MEFTTASVPIIVNSLVVEEGGENSNLILHVHTKTSHSLRCVCEMCQSIIYQRNVLLYITESLCNDTNAGRKMVSLVCVVMSGAQPLASCIVKSF